MIETWWALAEEFKVLALDDRFARRFAENAARTQGNRKIAVFHKGVGHVPTDVAPDLRSRDYRIEADTIIPDDGAEGVLIAHGDTTSGYSLYVRDNYLHHDLNVGGEHVVVTSTQKIAPGPNLLTVDVTCNKGLSCFTLQIDGQRVGSVESNLGFHMLISWSGLDIGRDRGNPVGDYASPFEFTGNLRKVTVYLDPDQQLDGEGVGKAEMARE
jgi:arylsulfatase